MAYGMYIRNKKGFTVLMLTFLILACQIKEDTDNDLFANLPKDKAGDIVRKAIDRAGGWDTWNFKRNFNFYKNITHLDSSGTVERSVRQHHIYNLKEGFKARMEWTIGEDHYLIINNGEKAEYYKNGEEQTDKKSIDEAWNSSYGSHYVIGMPFKLADPGVTLSYEGIDSILFDKPVYAIRVNYDKGAGSTGGMHLWYYYFEVEDYDLAGNFLDYGEGYSFTTYEVFEEVASLRIHSKRHSYSSNSKKERVMLKTIYENEEMIFDQSLDKNLFDLR